MNFKRTSRALCLFLVLCLLVNVSPIQAEATGITAAITGVIASNPIATLGAIIVALGVACVAEHNGKFDQLAQDCEAWIRDTTNYITEEGLYLAEYTYNGLSQLFVPEGLVQAVRDFLFSSGTLQTVTALSGSEITCTTMANRVGSNGRDASFGRLIRSSPENTMALIKGLGINSEVFIYSCTATKMAGIWFNELGQWTTGRFTNPAGVRNASLLGVHSLSSLILELSNSYNIYYSKDYAYKQADFATSACYALDWDTLPIILANSHDGIPVETKLSSNTVFTDFGFYDMVPLNSLYASISDTSELGIGEFTWDTTTYQTVTTDFDLKLESVALPDKSIADGYAYWNAGSISLPGNVTIPNQEEEKKYLPIVPMDKMEDIYDLTQDEAQTNTVTGNPTVDTETDRVTFTSLKELLESIRDHFSNWFARISLNVSNILQAVRDGFASLIAAVANIPKLIAGLFRFLAEQLRGLGFIWELLQMIGEYLGTIFGWMPETMRAIVMVTFAIAGLYMLIGR